MFARYNLATGALIEDGLPEAPEAGEGEAVIEMSPSAIAGITIWSADARGYVDRRRFSKPQFLDLWTPDETVAVMRSTDALMSYFWARTLAWDDVFILSDPRVEVGIMQAELLEILTEARAARIRAGLLPE